MKRLLNVAAVAALLAFVPLAVSTPSYAQSTFSCEVGYTGPNSENECVSEQTYVCEVDNENKVNINFENEQVATSGDVTVDNSGQGGGATSGTSSNNNTVNFTVAIDNGSEEPCFARHVVPAKETPEEPKEPGRGGVEPEQDVTPTALPVTSGSSAPVVLASIGGLAAVAGIAAAYRRLQLQD